VLSRGDYHWQHEPCFYALSPMHPARRIVVMKSAQVGLTPPRAACTPRFPIELRELMFRVCDQA